MPKQDPLLTRAELLLLNELHDLCVNPEHQRSVIAQFEVKLPTRSCFIDVAIPESMVGIEIDSSLAIYSPEDNQKEAQRDAVLSQMGWTILRFTDAEIESNPSIMVAAVKEAVEKKENRA